LREIEPEHDGSCLATLRVAEVVSPGSGEWSSSLSTATNIGISPSILGAVISQEQPEPETVQEHSSVIGVENTASSNRIGNSNVKGSDVGENIAVGPKIPTTLPSQLLNPDTLAVTFEPG
jgi:hypothetical protein